MNIFYRQSRYVTILLFILIGGILLLGGCAETTKSPEVKSSESQGTIELSFSHFFPVTDMIETDMVQVWISRIEEATDNRVKINSYAGQTLVPSAETYESVVEGVVDIGLSCHGYTRGKFPIVDTLMLPGITYANSKAATYALMEVINTLNPVELQDTKHLWSWGNAPGGLMMQNPVRKLEDLAGVEIGVTAGPRADAFKMLGAVPVTLPMPDWYESLQRGVMRGGIAGLDTMKTFKLGEVTGDYITTSPFMFNQTFFVVMNQEKWDSLPRDIQDIIDQVTDDFFHEIIAEFWFAYAEEGLNFTRGIKDVEIIELADDEIARWLEVMQPIMDQHIEFLNGRNLPGEDIVNTILKIVEDNNEKYGNI